MSEGGERRNKLVEGPFLVLVHSQREVCTHLHSVEERDPRRCEAQEKGRDEDVHHSEEERYLSDHNLISSAPLSFLTRLTLSLNLTVFLLS